MKRGTSDPDWCVNTVERTQSSKTVEKDAVDKTLRPLNYVLGPNESLPVASSSGLFSNEAVDLLCAAGSAAFRSGIKEPIKALTQLANRALGSSIIPEPDIPESEAPTQPDAAKWYAEVIGSGLGMVAPIILAEKLSSAVLRGCGKGAVSLAQRTGVEARTIQAFTQAVERSRVLRVSLPVGKSLMDGALFGGLLVPSANTGERFWDEKFKHATVGGVTFGGQRLALQSLFGTWGKLGVPVHEAALRSSDALAMRIGTNMLAGSFAGIINAQTDSLMSGKGLASGDSMKQCIATFAVAGIALDLIHTPVQFKPKRDLRTSIEFPATAATNSMRLEVAPALEPAAARRAEGLQPLDSAGTRFSQVEVVPQKLVAAKPGATPDFTSFESFVASSVKKDVQPARVYTVEGHNTQIVVPEAYAVQLDAVRDARAGGKPLEPHLDGLRFRALPEDFVPVLDRLPDSSLVQRLILSPEANPIDPWYARQEGDPSFKSAASANANGDVVFYQKDVDPFIRLETNHEWAHLLRRSRGRESSQFELALKVEPEAPGLRDRANLNSDEMWSVMMGEHLLDGGAPSSQGQLSKLDVLGRNAPIKTSILADAILNNSFETGMPLPENVRTLMDRVQLEVKPVAVAKLAEFATTSANPAVRENSARLLLQMGQAQHLAHAAEPVSITANFDAITDQHVAPLAQVPLAKLSLSHAQITNIEFLNAGRHGQLQHLDLSGTQLSSAELAPLSRLAGLQELRLAGTAITDGAINHLGGLSKLKMLDVSNTQMSAAGLAALRGRLPDCRIISN